MSIDWPDGTPVACPVCGATIGYSARGLHERWHEKLQREMRSASLGIGGLL